MRKIIVSLFIAMACSTQAIAHTIGMGYANKQPGYSSGKTVTGKTSASAAICLQADRLSRYQGNGVKTVRVSLPETKVYIDSVVVWVRSDINGQNLATGKITRFKNDGLPDLHSGWNEAELSSPVSITGSQPLYIGYTYYQRTKVCATCIVDSEQDGTSFWQPSTGSSWEELKGSAFAIEAGIDGNQMPARDFWLMAVRGIIQGDGTRQVEARVYNRGQLSASSIDFNCEADGFSRAVTASADIQPDQMDTVLITLPEAGQINAGTHCVLTLSRIDGQADEYPADNQAECQFNYLRRVLIEEFTTEQCPNCPRVGQYIHNLLEGANSMEKNLAVVCHHSGYHTDWLTLPADNDYTWFYNNNGGTYAPAVMYNRAMWDDGATSPVSNPHGEAEMRAVIQYLIDEASALVLSSSAQYSEDGKAVEMTVTGKRLHDFGHTAEKRITVYLTEDNILAQSQAGSGTDTYYHQHVTRAINSTWGVPVEWNGDDFTYTFRFHLDDTWKRGDLKVIAAIGDYDASDPCNCQIENTTLAVPSATSAIHNAKADTKTTPSAYYTLGGVQLNEVPQRGIYIEKYSDGSHRKVVLP